MKYFTSLGLIDNYPGLTIEEAVGYTENILETKINCSRINE